MKPEQTPLLKEIYEKGKVKKLADGMQDDAKKMLPPFMKGKKNPAEERARQVGSDAAKRRLAAMKTKNKPGAK